MAGLPVLHLIRIYMWNVRRYQVRLLLRRLIQMRIQDTDNSPLSDVTVLVLAGQEMIQQLNRRDFPVAQHPGQLHGRAEM